MSVAPKQIHTDMPTELFSATLAHLFLLWAPPEHPGPYREHWGADGPRSSWRMSVGPADILITVTFPRGSMLSCERLSLPSVPSFLLAHPSGCSCAYSILPLGPLLVTSSVWVCSCTLLQLDLPLEHWIPYPHFPSHPSVHLCFLAIRLDSVAWHCWVFGSDYFTNICLLPLG